MLASFLLIVIFLSLIVWGSLSLFSSLYGDGPNTAPEAPVTEMHLGLGAEEQRSPGITSRNS
jgi:hypothetical protein